MLKQILLISLAIFLILLILMYIWQRHLIYFPSKEIPNRANYAATDMEEISLETEDHLHLSSWYKAAQKNQPTILYLHGNAGHIGYRMPLARFFLEQGLGVLLLEYRGYGGNLGSPSEQGLYKDAEAAVRYLKTHQVLPKQMVLYGESLGTGVALKLAVDHPACAVILQSPYTSLADLAKYHYPWLFLKPWDRFESVKHIKHVKAPLLMLQGKHDEIVPYNQSQILFHAANDPKKLHFFPYGNHQNLWQQPKFKEEIMGFIQKFCDLN